MPATSGTASVRVASASTRTVSAAAASPRNRIRTASGAQDQQLGVGAQFVQAQSQAQRLSQPLLERLGVQSVQQKQMANQRIAAESLDQSLAGFTGRADQFKHLLQPGRMQIQ